MPLVACSPADDPARSLLDEYFLERIDGFRDAGGYRVVHPDPAAFRAGAGVFLVAVADDGTAAGCGGVRRIAPGSAGTRFEIKHLFTRPTARGAGIGRALLAGLESSAAHLGAVEVVLDTNADLVAAARLYATAGYLAVPAYNDNPNATTWLGKRL